MAYVLLRDGAAAGTVELVDADDAGRPVRAETVDAAHLADVVRRREVDHPRWAWDDAALRYPPLLIAGVRVERCHDLRLCHAIVRRSTYCSGSELAQAPPGAWDGARPDAEVAPASLFDVDEAPRPPEALTELALQLDAVATASAPGRLRLLLAAESTGALIAAEMHADGLPWDAAVHDRILTALLGPRPRAGGRPARLEALAQQVRERLGQPTVNLDSQPELLAALHRAGVAVRSTRVHELREVDDPVIAPLLEYKKLARLLSANGWAWLDTWVVGGRFRPDYVPGGVVTGRWATSGGGALQIPAVIRAAARADPGWRLVVADAAQLEPRVLAAMSGDAAMAAAARGADLYQGFVDAGVVESRKHAKTAMLGAMYGATTGASAVLMPQLERAFPRAIGMVEEAARAGERFEVVTTWLGRSSPVPGEHWTEAVAAAASVDASPEDARTARARRRDWGRFTRNFVVQGTAAEWALCWMAALRRRLAGIPGRPHLVFFLHDEVVVHSPAAVADDVAQAVREAAAEAGRLLFGDCPVEWALDVSVVEGYDQAA